MGKGIVILCSVLLVFSGCRPVPKEVPAIHTPAPSVEPVRTASPSQEPSPAVQTPAAETKPVQEEVKPPDNNWQFDEPENHGVDSETLRRLHDAISEIDIYSVVIVKDGFIIDEYYKENYDENSVFRLHSCTKSVTSALIGVAIDKGLLDGVDTELSVFFPALADVEGKKEITLAHLLTHTSGISWPESGGPMFHEFVESENWVDFVLAQPMAAKPDSIFNYSTGGSHLLSAVIEKAAGQTMYDFAREHLLQPLGMDSVEWSTDPQGITDGGNGIAMSARDAAKFGQLYLQGGQWKERRIIPETWVTESTKRQSKAQPSSGYGYQWWLRSFGDIDTYYAVGHGGQYIVVAPALALVAVSTGRFPSGRYPFLNYFRDYILAACES